MGLSADDRFEIQDLLLQYAAHNTGDEAVLFEVFTEDVELEGPRGYWRGAEGLQGFYEQSGPPDPDSRGPLVTNVLVDGDGDEATMTAQILQVKGKPGSERAIGTGWYECTARRVDGRWKLSKRITHIDGLPLFRDTPAYQSGARWVRRDGGWALEPAATSE